MGQVVKAVAAARFSSLSKIHKSNGALYLTALSKNVHFQSGKQICLRVDLAVQIEFPCKSLKSIPSYYR